jgi:hypothetical protein
MPIKISPALLILLALVACTAPAPETIETAQQEGTWGACQRNYPCQPGTPWSVVICDAVCGEDGGYCEPYDWREEEWCWLHPGATDGGRIVCDRWGNPVSPTRCLPYVMP